MPMSRIILSIAAILLTVGMYFLPKVVVEDQHTETPENLEEITTPDFDANHRNQLTEEEAALIKDFKRNYKEINPEKSATFADSLAGLFASLDFLDSAAFYYRKAAEAEPTTERHKKAGNSHYELFNFAVDPGERDYWANQAREYYHKVLSEEPNSLEVKAKLALTYLPEQPMKGVVMLREVVESDPNNALALYNLGILSLQSAQYQRAVERFESLVNSHPNHVEGQFYLAIAYYENGETAKARDQFLKVREMETDPQVKSTVEEYLQELK